MTFKQDAYRKSLLRAIHQNYTYSQLHASGVWEDWLFIRFGVTSSKDLSIKELKHTLSVLNDKVEDTLNLMPDLAGRTIMQQSTKDGGITLKQSAAIRSLWEQKARDKSEVALLNFVKKATGTLFISLECLKKGEATKVLIALAKVR